MLRPIPPIDTIELFPPLAAELIRTLRGLSDADWNAPTACSPWTVKDVAAHLLDTMMRRLSFGRDHLQGTPPDEDLSDFDTLVRYINRLNEDWVRVFRSVSAPQLIEFMETREPQLYAYFKSLPQDEPAGISVAWAGETTSMNWMDIAREYTERWLHQQHIRDAVGLPLLLDQQFARPMFDAFIRSLPRAYRDTTAPQDTAVTIRITGNGGGIWSLIREGDAWRLYEDTAPSPAASLSLDQDVAWRLFSKGITPDAARSALHVEGDSALAEGLLKAVAIMA